MAFCRNCGKQIDDNVLFCSFCGTSTRINQPVMYIKPKTPGRGFGISSMVLGIIGLVYALSFSSTFLDLVDLIDRFHDFDADDIRRFIQLILYISVMPVLSLCFSNAAFKRGYKNGVSNSGLIMGVIGLVINILSYIFAVLHHM